LDAQQADFVDADPATFYIDGVRYDDSYDLETALAALEVAV